jgi:uncharacterized DUF497 family protein
MRYEWDERKNLRNQQRHGISFEAASLVFEDQGCLVYPDRIDRSTGEQRWHALGAISIQFGHAAVLAVVMSIGRSNMAKQSSVSSRPARLKRMSSADIGSKRWTERERRSLRRIAARQAAGDDSHVNFTDIPRLTGEQLAKMVRLRDVRRPKIAVSVRLDPEVLDWLKSKGKGHLTRINDILSNLMEAEPR